MARQNGQATFETPLSDAAFGDAADSTSTQRAFTAWERMTVVEVGCKAEAGVATAGDTALPGVNFAYTVSKRTGGDVGNDVVIPVFTAAFAAEGGVGGDPSVNNFDNANQIPNGIITNTQGLLTGGKCLRAYTEVTLDKGDQLVFKVTGAGAGGSLVVFYAKTYLDGAGLVEAADVDSN